MKNSSKKKWKRILAMMLAVALVLGLWPTALESRAADPTPVALTLTGAMFGGGNADEGTTNCSNIWLAGNANGIASPTWNAFQPVDETDGIWVESERDADAYLVNHNNAGGWFATGFTATEGQTITIKGTFKYDESSCVEIAEVQFKWTGSAWKEVTNATPVTLTLTDALFNGGGADSGTTNCSYLWLAGSASGLASPNFEAFAPVDSTAGIWVENQRIDGGVLLNHSEQTNGWRAQGFTATAGQTVTIKGIFNYGSSYVEIEEVQFKWTGSAWEEVINATPVTLTLTGALFNGGSADSGTTNCSYLWLAGSASGLESPNFEAFAPVDSTAGIWVEDQRIDGGVLLNHSEQTNGWRAQGFTATAGQTVTIKGIFNYGSSYVKIEEVKFKWTGSSWKEVAEETTTYQSFTYDGINGATGYSDESSFWNVYLHPTIEVPGTAWSTSFTGLQVQVGDGDPFDVAVKKTDHEGTTYFTIGSDKLPKAVEKGTKVIVKAGKADPNEGTEGIELTEDFVMYALGNGEGFTTEEPTTYTTFNVTGFVNYGTSCGYDGSNWNLYLTTDSELPGAAWEDAFPVTVAVDDTEITIAAKQGNDSRQLYMSIPGSTLTNGADATVVIKAGEYDCTDSNKKIGYKIATDFTFYSSKHGWSTSANILDANVTRGISLRLSAASHGPSFSVDTNKNDGVTASDDWSQKIYAVRNESSTADALYFDNENGVKIDGVDQKKPLPLVKLLDTTYYVALHDVLGSTLANGDYTVGGVFRDANGKLVEFYPITVNYADGTWTEVVSQTDIQYDANGDLNVDSKDLVRLIRYCANNTVPINELQADINNSGAVDRDDIASLRKVLLGIISYPASGTEGSNAPFGNPTYTMARTVERMAYSCPSAGTWDGDTFTPNENLGTELQKYKAAGFTLLSSEFVAPLRDDELTEEKQPALVYYLEQAKKNGLGVIVSAPWLNSLLKNGNSEIEIPNFNQTLSDGSSYWKAILTQYVSFLKQYPAFEGFMMSDELSVKYAENYATIVSCLKELDPSLNLHSSQLPVTAYDISSIGADALTNDKATNSTKELAYKDYVKTFGLANGSFTFDLYPLYLKSNILGSENYSVNEEWFDNLKWVTDVVKENDYAFTTGVTIQSCKLAGTSSIWSSYDRYAPTEKADIGFQVYTAMAYGMQEINYYTYAAHPQDTTVSDSIADNEGVYNAVRAVNAEIAYLEDVFKAFTWKDTLDIAAGGSNTSTGNARLASVSAANARAFVGCMKDSDGFDGYMVANAEGPRAGKTATVTLTFNSATKAMIYKGTTCETVSLTGGVCTATLAAGEGAFIIPIR